MPKNSARRGYDGLGAKHDWRKTYDHSPVPIITHYKRRRKRIRLRRTTANEIIAAIAVGTMLAWLIQTTILLFVQLAINMGAWM